MAVIKFKPTRSPRTLDGRRQVASDHFTETLSRSRVAVAQSKQLIERSQEVMQIIHKRRKRKAA